MKHFFTKLLHVRTALMLLLTAVLTLTAQTAWAQDPVLVTELPTVDGGQSTNWNTTDENYGSLVDGKFGKYKYGLSNADPWVEFHYSEAFVPKAYILWTANDSEGTRNPKTWTIKAKLNEGDAWTPIATVDNSYGDQLPKTNDTSKEFSLASNTTAYRYFRFEATRITSGSNSGQFQLAELQFKSAPKDPTKLQYATISGVNSNYLYTGSAISITPTVKDADGTTLTLGTHYTVTIKNSSNETVTTVIDEGTYTLTVTAKDGSGYTGSKSVSFNVTDCPEGLSIDNDYNRGDVGYYYVNMPAKGTATSIGNAAMLDLSSYDVTSFKLYDDGGKGGKYSNSYRGYLVITAPAGYILRLSGNIATQIGVDYLTVWDGTDTSDDSKKLLNAVYGTSYSQETAIATVFSTGESMTLYFYSNTDYNYAGLDLTVEIVSNPNDFEYVTISGVESNYSYIGSAISITPTMTAYDGTTLTLGTDYTATLNGNNVTSFPLSINATGDYTLTVTGMGDYTGSKSVSFTVTDVRIYLSIDTDYSEGEDGYYYVNMPTTGTKTLIIPEGLTSTFKVYDDGGKNGRYSQSCNGIIVLTAPAGCNLQLSGSITLEESPGINRFVVYDNNAASGTQLFYGASTTDGAKTDIGTLTSTGQSMTLVFYSKVYYNHDGLDLTVTIFGNNNLSYTTISGVNSSYVYTGSAISITPTVKKVDGTELTLGTDYTATLNGNSVTSFPLSINATGDYTLTVTGTGDNTGTQSVSFSVIEPLSGSGTQSSPYLIGSIADMTQFANSDFAATYWASDVYVKLTADLTYDGTENNYTPVGTNGNPFYGHFNGDGHTISGINISGTSSYLGIFGYITNAEVSGIILANSTFEGYFQMGGIVGYSNNGLVSDCWVKDDVTINAQFDDIGGIVGNNSTGTVRGCTSAATVSGSSNYGNCIGGIVGTNGNIENSLYTGNSVTGESLIGAIAGYEVTDYNNDFCYNIANNYYTQVNIGGIKGSDTNGARKAQVVSIDNEAAVAVSPTGTSTFYKYSGITAYANNNVVGYNDGNATTFYSGATETVSLTLDEGYAVSDLTVTYTDGEGAHNVTLTKVNDQTYTFEMPAADVTVSATVAVKTYTVAFDKNATDATGTMDPQAFTYGTAQNLTANAFTREGYTFMGWNTQADGNGTTYTDEQEVNNLTTEAGATVTLYAQWTFESWPGSGNENDPYLISSREALNELASKVNNGTTYINEYFKVTADINYTGAPMSYDDGNSNYVAIGDKDHLFRGNFDGDGHTIRGIRINKNANYQGLFGYMGAAVVKNVVLADTRITIGSSNYYAGGIAGRTTKIGNYGYNTIENCHVGSDVYIIGQTGGSYGSDIGGIVGENSGYVRNCTSAATVSGNENVGAIMGYHAQMSMENCLVLNATVSGTKRAGAIVGFMSATALEHNYYLPNGNVKGVGYNNNYDSPFDFTNNDGAVPGYLVTVGEGVTASTPALTLDVPGPGMTVAQTYRVFKEGQTVTLGHTERDGYIFGSYVVKDADNNDVTVTETSGVYTFVMPAKNVTADAEWTSNGNITWTLENGVLTISGTGPMDDYGWTWDDNTSPFYEKRNEITSVVITEGVTHIGDRAFIWCSKITSVSIPASVETIGESVFLNCTGITEFTVDANNNNFTSDGGLLYNKTKTSLLNFPSAKTGSVTIPGTVTSLAASTFNSAKISALDLSACTSLTTIENSLCYNCSNLQTVTLPASIKVIKSQAFRECGSLQSINLNACTGLTKIGDTSFYGCASLEGSYTLPATLTCISSSSFTNCAKLTKLTLTSVENFADDPDDNYDSNGFGSGAFDGCTSLTLELPEATTLAIMAADGHTWKEYLDIIPMPSSYTGMTFVRNGHNINAKLDGNANTTVAIPADVKVSNIVLTRTYPADQVSTWMMPFGTSVYSKGLKFYTFSGVEYNEETGKWVATMTQLTYPAVAEANTPYLVKGGESSELNTLPDESGFGLSYFTLNTTTNDKKTVVGNWTFKGTYEEKTWTDADVNDYGFAANNATGVTAGDFVHLVSGAHIKPMRSYLTYTGTDDPWAAAGARGANRAANGLPQSITVILVDADGSTTEIDAAEVGIEFDSSDWYDLSGRKLIGKPTKKGMYIHNGRTVVVK